jgi:hypothetical protein
MKTEQRKRRLRTVQIFLISVSSDESLYWFCGAIGLQVNRPAVSLLYSPPFLQSFTNPSLYYLIYTCKYRAEETRNKEVCL